MNSLSGKVQSPDGFSKVFMFDDVMEAVSDLKVRLKRYCKGKLLNKSIGDLNEMIDASFSDVTNVVTTEFRNHVKRTDGGDVS